MNKIRENKGFTLLEILLVVAAIAILAGIVIIAINPAKQLGDTRNAQRSSDINTLLNAIWQYSIDNNGNLPAGIDGSASTYQVIGSATTTCDTTCGAVGSTTASCVDLTAELVPDYIAAVPFDPQTASTTNTDYYVNKVGNRVTIGVCDPEQGAVLEVTR
ncbi:hypothetical protein A3I18_00675 [Candidatus Campbellbacteria bacterium RIFCSPLOWO2_02_FULL_35_11]|uniref:Type II secretion system protein GspG C-terminal domain-containing protein n=2 Tax=Candidatus Campbelliibacteriota TaxID=1752727 RepID=A0A1F5EPA4_9BACT|nr:MAG: hypothetical protein A3E89_01225 [Candidatus Campbellbacteria bacterium RIFCSPHIGHO2_12_FULL_35_10]OGD69897.1 MAG: hypothetical protein A3I18_00675 [Candidatus Campbellbacteria bacterium RIFCSPLOWO2_02_FULL_35_11]